MTHRAALNWMLGVAVSAVAVVVAAKGLQLKMIPGIALIALVAVSGYWTGESA